MTATSTAETPLPRWMRLLRPRQWAKNLLVFAAPLGAGMLLAPDVLRNSLIAFVAFSGAASAMYALNDVVDADRDRAHPTKRLRPIAAGEITTGAGMTVGLVLGLTSLAVATWVAPPLGGVLGIYILITVGYSARLKHVPVVDMIIVASGFVLRAIAGGVAADVPISSWFLIVTSFGALFVVAGKRYAELTNLTDNGSTHRPSLEAYSPEYLRHVLTLSAGLAAIAYCLWAFEVPREGTPQLLMQLSIVPFVTALLRYGHIVMEGRGGEPEEVFLRDRELVVLGALWLALFASGVSLG